MEQTLTAGLVLFQVQGTNLNSWLSALSSTKGDVSKRNSSIHAHNEIENMHTAIYHCYLSLLSITAIYHCYIAVGSLLFLVLHTSEPAWCRNERIVSGSTGQHS